MAAILATLASDREDRLNAIRWTAYALLAMGCSDDIPGATGGAVTFLAGIVARAEEELRGDIAALEAELSADRAHEAAPGSAEAGERVRRFGRLMVSAARAVIEAAGEAEAVTA